MASRPSLFPNDEVESVRTTKREIFESFTFRESARAADVLRADLTVGVLPHLVCGVEHAVRLGSPDDFHPLLQVMLNGLRTPADS